MFNPETPFVSVLIPTYNRKEDILLIMEKLSLQTYPSDRFEVVVIIDGSQDGTLEALEKLETPFSLKIQWQENTGNMYESRNISATLAQGTVFILLDDDVIPTSTLVAEHVRYLQDAPDSVIIGYMPIVETDSNERDISAQIYTKEYEKDWKWYQLHPDQAGMKLWAGNLGMIRTTFETINGFDAVTFNGYAAGDTDFGIRAAKAGFKVVTNEKAVGYHHHRTSFEAMLRRAYRKGFAEVRLYQKHDMPLTDLWFQFYGHMSLPVQILIAFFLNFPLAYRGMMALFQAFYSVGGPFKLRLLQIYSFRLLRYLRVMQGLVDELGGWDKFKALGEQYQSSDRTVTAPGR